MIYNKYLKLINYSLDYNPSESSCVLSMLKLMSFSKVENAAASRQAKFWIENIRQNSSGQSAVTALMSEYKLSDHEGIVLMSLVEALLRIPDKVTRKQLISDKIGSVVWHNKSMWHSKNFSAVVNLSNLGLSISKKLISLDQHKSFSVLNSLVKKLGEPIIAIIVEKAVNIIAKSFVLGQDIEQAYQAMSSGYLYSFDMLGEKAYSRQEADTYFQAYSKAITKVGESAAHADQSLYNSHGISVKLSALHPCYDLQYIDSIIDELYPDLLALCQQAQSYNIGLFIDAEEAKHLEMSLLILEKLCAEEALKSWDGLGFVVQSYQKRALKVTELLTEFAVKYGRNLMVRLVKGAYWDSEIKYAQQSGIKDYPVFTHKAYSDLCYLSCAQIMLKAASEKKNIYCCFATHNAATVAQLLQLIKRYKIATDNFEFQRLHGMGEALYKQLMQDYKTYKVRIYAPVGKYKDLLPYLVRRLLENGANSGFVRKLNDNNISIKEIICDPVKLSKQYKGNSHPQIPKPCDIFNLLANKRQNSRTFNLKQAKVIRQLSKLCERQQIKGLQACPIINGKHYNMTKKVINIVNPADHSKCLGSIIYADKQQIKLAAKSAAEGFKIFSKTTAEQRAKILEKCADNYEKNMPVLINLLIEEAGKTVEDAISEIREAVDFLRYYAGQAIKIFAENRLPNFVGQSNILRLKGRGVFLCISPWNFPLAIFTGQIAAALAAGNSVIAKPAAQTPLIAYLAIKLFHESGIDEKALHFLPAEAENISNILLDSKLIQGVAFTGSTQTADIINQKLAQSGAPIIPFIAETGGQNAMIVDSSALIYQVTEDVITSAFKSAGQRCSALRVLYLQEEIAEKQIEMICGRATELNIGDPQFFKTDIGPVIDKKAQTMLYKHVKKMNRSAKLLFACKLNSNINNKNSSFFPPHIYQIDSLKQLTHEVFGPILHIIIYKKSELNKVIEEINNSGYGLTLSIHSRINKTIEQITDQVEVGNIYVNRNQIGAIVEMQPFGGQKLSGTGPKAGGPNYLPRFTVEQTITTDNSATTGSTELMLLE